MSGIRIPNARNTDSAISNARIPSSSTPNVGRIPSSRISDVERTSGERIPFVDAISTGILVIAKRNDTYYVHQTNKQDIHTATDIVTYLKEIHIYKYFRRSRKERCTCSVDIVISNVDYNVVLNTLHSKTYIYFNVIQDTKLTELLCTYNRNIKHELGNILNQVSLIHDVVTIQNDSPLLEYTNCINRSTVDMISLLNDYNDYYNIKMHPERISLNMTTVSIKGLLDYAIGIIKTKTHHNYTFKIRVHKAITTVSVDKNKLLQLILSVISNGIFASGPPADAERYTIKCSRLRDCIVFAHSHASRVSLKDGDGVHGVFALKLISILGGSLIEDSATKTVYSIPVQSPDELSSADSFDTFTFDSENNVVYVCIPPSDKCRDTACLVLTDANIPFHTFDNVVSLMYHISMLPRESKRIHIIIITNMTKWAARQKSSYSFVYINDTCIKSTIYAGLVAYTSKSNANALVSMSEPGRMPPPRVLIIDSHAIHRKTIESILRKLGIFKIETAFDYVSALDAINRSDKLRKPFTIIFIDILLQGDTLSRVVRINNTRAMLVALINKHENKTFPSSAFNRVLCKPVDTSSVTEIISEYHMQSYR